MRPKGMPAAAGRAVVAAALIAATFTVVGTVGVVADPAAAEAAPEPAPRETVTAAALPTVQVDGVVWDQVIVGDRVYVTGEFSRARPPGAAAGTNETVRSNILAYDLNTGQLVTSWAPSLNAQGRVITASPDGSRIYVGGDFDQVNGQWRSRIAAIDAQTGAVLAFNPGANATVRAIAAHNNTVYYGGHFTAAGTSQTGFSARSRLAAANATSGALLLWSPSADQAVFSIVVHAPSNRVIVAGQFTTLNTSQQWGMGSLDGTSGATMAWAANTVIQNRNDNAAISSLTTDGEKIYGVGWAFFGGGATANFEGAFAADPLTGELDWVDGGRGDNYDVSVADGVVYAVGHPHDWGMLDWNPQYPEPWRFQRAVAIDTRRSPTLTNAFGTPDTWQPFAGRPAAQPLHWLPTLTGGTYTGQGQAAWSVASNGTYTVLAGEFPRVNGASQQGLVRFAKRSVAPSVDAIQSYTELTPTLTPAGPGRVRVGWTAAWDRDDLDLTVEVLRGDTTSTSTVVRRVTTRTTWWNRPPLGFLDAGAPPGSTQTYRIRVTDPHGQVLVGPPANVTVPAGAAASSTYAASVLADGADWHWRLGETAGTAALDGAGSNDATLGSTTSRNVAGALLNESDPATSFPGSSDNNAVQGTSSYWQPGPQRFSLEAWVKTSTSQGGKILGFGNNNDARSSIDGNDRVLYMSSSGQIYFGVRPDMGTRITVNSPAAYRDNAWHHVVGSLGDDGMKLYVDGNLVASNADVTKAQVYRGYWRIGGDRTTSWPAAPTREAITATIDEVAVYPKALSIGRVRAHYLASGRSPNFPNTPPVASFATTPKHMTVAFDASGSVDEDGSIATYAWSFGDGTTGTGAAPQHTYAAPGEYTVTLTITDNRGGTDTTVRTVEATVPPPNQLPVASFTSAVAFHTATLTSTSSDPDGTVVGHAWSFGDGTTGSGASVQHIYALAGSYPVTLTVTDDRGDTSTTQGTVVITDGFATDTFERTVASGFGSADNGGPWTVSGTSGFSVSGGAGRVVGAVNGNRSAYLTTVRQTDVEIATQLALDSAATGGGAYVSLIGRRVSNGNDYRLKVRYLAGGTVAAYLVRTLGGTETTLASVTVPGLTVSPGTPLMARLQIDGTSSTVLRAKVWRRSASEPSSWQLTGTDSVTPAALRVPGDLGVLLYVSSSWTGAAPALALDDFSASGHGGPPPNQAPTALFSSVPQYMTAWFDASASFDSDGAIASYAWTFGDGTTGSGINPQHVYAAEGTYPVTLTVTDTLGLTGTTTGTVTVVAPPPPTAFFEANAHFLTVSFDASGSEDVDGDIVSYQWAFGDGATGTGPVAQHTYAAPGTYPVTLTVTAADGQTGIYLHDVSVQGAPEPTAAFISSAQHLAASFDASGSFDLDGTITSYAWTFGDGTTGTGVNPQHTYASAGTYAVTLTVTDDAGQTGSVTHDITVVAPPVELALDTFGRTVTNGLGTAEVGGAWTLSGAASSFQVSNGVARITGAAGSSRAAYLTAVRQTDVDITMDAALGSASSANGAYLSVIGRRASSGNDYRLKLRYMTDRTVVAHLVRTLGGTETTLAYVTVPGLLVSPGDVLRTRFQVIGTTGTVLRAKVWRATSAEPPAWTVATTDASTPVALRGPGDVGAYFYLSGSWATAAPTIVLDNLRVITATE